MQRKILVRIIKDQYQTIYGYKCGKKKTFKHISNKNREKYKNRIGILLLPPGPARSLGRGSGP